MATQDLPDIELLRKLLSYDQETGKLYWRPRPREMFDRGQDWRRWNNRYAGEEAFPAKDRDGYRQGSIFNKHYRAHRVIWALVYGEWPPEHIDHINGNRTDNRLVNLRAVSNAENHKNEKRPKNNTSGVMGVYWHKQLGAWQARIVIAGKRKHLGCFKSKDDAIAARAAAEIKYGFHPNHGRPI